MEEQTKGYVHSIETFGSVDGPGVRFVVFMQGCRMRCEFCHNPDTWNIGGGKEYTADVILDQAERYRSYWGKQGGITISGGEPLLQIDFLIELFQKAKERGIHTTIDTCGKPFSHDEPFFSRFEELMNYTDLLLFDIKHIDNEAHKKLTHWGNENILEMAQYLSDIKKPVWIRHVLVPERSDYDEYLIRLDAFIKTLENVDRVEILPYHTMGKYKWETLGLTYPLEGIEPPTKERVENAKRLLHIEDYTKYLTR
ncbi:pyruvate formate-lyase-activating protein [Enterococcus spodopteracolus]|uniref:pyruvate formate-lyase-activating protein n=1 Tax=Enterococcus spodopteracolus TaxID=3034501 RepID=UPI00264765AD|nr:pyruvate formate-lyase-activating protein [Enterococcus spodopteracolus]